LLEPLTLVCGDAIDILWGSDDVRCQEMSKLVLRFETEVCLKAQPKMGYYPGRDLGLGFVVSLLMRPPITIV